MNEKIKSGRSWAFEPFILGRSHGTILSIQKEGEKPRM